MGLGELFAAGCALSWAIAVILLKKSGEQLPPLALNLVKGAMVLPLFAVTVVVAEGAAWPVIGWGDLGWILASGFIGIAVGDTLYFRALNRIGASTMAVAQALYSPFVILLSMLVLGERFLPMQWGGLALVLGGILLVSYSRFDASVHGSGLRVGIAWAVLSVLAMAIGIVMAKPMLERHSFLWVVSLRVFAGFAGLALAALLRGELRRIWTAYRQVRHWGWIVAGALVGTYLSMMLWLAGYKYTQASIAAVLNELAAVFILPLAVLILREPVQARQWIGVGLALAGVTLVVI